MFIVSEDCYILNDDILPQGIYDVLCKIRSHVKNEYTINIGLTNHCYMDNIVIAANGIALYHIFLKNIETFDHISHIRLWYPHLIQS